MRLTLTLFAALALAMPAVAQSQGDSMKTTPQPNTYCLGRFLIDLPSDAEIMAQTAEYRGDKIKVERQTSDKAFQQMIADKENKLRETKHKTEPSLLRHVSHGDAGNSAFLVYRETPTSRALYDTEIYKWTHGYQYIIRSYASPDKVDLASDIANRALSELRYRDPKEIPTEPGFCIERGFFAGEPAMPHYEYAYVHFRLKEHPDVIVTVTTRLVMKEDHEGLLDRIDRKSKDAGLLELLNKIKVLRRGKHPAGDIPGEDYLQSIPTGETFSTHTFFWESIAKTKNLYAPEISVEFESGKINIGGYSKPSVSDKQAIELFDSIVNSIRVRPVSSPTPSPEPSPHPVAPQSRLPLGASSASLSRCPQTGLWECAAELAAGEKRRFFPQGMVFPTVIVRRPERSLWQKMKGEPPNVLAETTWTLVGYDAPGKDVS
jgi:hypothetical protein